MPKAYKTKVCAICGKSEDAHWARHWKNQHPLSVIRELTPGEVPSDPYDESWLYLINPLSLREVHESAAKIKEVPQTDEDISNSATATIPEGRSQIPTKYIEIDVESDDQEESKHGQPAAEEDTFSDLPTQKLFKMANRILSII
jgi:hypothetical protein